MKILLVHNFYGSEAPSGENAVFEAEAQLLKSRGHEVREFVKHSDSIRGQGIWGLVRGAFNTPWSRASCREIKALIDSWRPDIVHAHNTFPLISPAIFRAVPGDIPSVLTLHNYRLFCAAGIPMRVGTTCTRCLDAKSSFPALRHRCYRGSLLATVPLALSIQLHRVLGTWREKVAGFITLSEFQKALMIEAGLPSDKVHVKPNFFPGNPAVVPWEKRPERVVYAGRLGEEKGIRDLVTAWALWGDAAPELVIVGEGPVGRELRESVAARGQRNVTFLGRVSAERTHDEISRARLVVLPSRCFEGFPMVIREAFAFGTPVAASRLGPLPSIVADGVCGALFEPGDSSSILETVRRLWDDQAALRSLADGARKQFEKFYTEEANYETLFGIYKKAMEGVSRGK